jgi:hypothetical protein
VAETPVRRALAFEPCGFSPTVPRRQFLSGPTQAPTIKPEMTNLH